jgi:hypothetical protein
MRVHYLKCGTDCPFGGALFDGFSKGLFGLIPCAAQLVETNDGLVLIDTGYGVEDVRHPHPRLSRFFMSCSTSASGCTRRLATRSRRWAIRQTMSATSC